MHEIHRILIYGTVENSRLPQLLLRSIMKNQSEAGMPINLYRKSFRNQKVDKTFVRTEFTREDFGKLQRVHIRCDLALVGRSNAIQSRSPNAHELKPHSVSR